MELVNQLAGIAIDMAVVLLAWENLQKGKALRELQARGRRSPLRGRAGSRARRFRGQPPLLAAFVCPSWLARCDRRPYVSALFSCAVCSFKGHTERNNASMQVRH